jgi:hypothetical protein
MFSGRVLIQTSKTPPLIWGTFVRTKAIYFRLEAGKFCIIPVVAARRLPELIAIQMSTPPAPQRRLYNLIESIPKKETPSRCGPSSCMRCS